MSRTVFLLVLLSVAAFSVDKPEIEWVRLYDDVVDILDLAEGTDGLVLGSTDALFLTDGEGTRQWIVTPDSVEWHYLKFQSVIVLQDGCIVSTGVGKVMDSSSFSVFLVKVDPEGNTVWIKSYDNPSTTDYAFDVIELPDGGFALAARQGGEAWILRTDSQGDTLWTREWGWIYNDMALAVLCVDNGLTVLAHGRTPETTNGPHLLRYNLDGNPLWLTDFPDWPGTGTTETMCESSANGFLIMDHYWPTIVHTSFTGDPEWWFWPPGADQPYGNSLSTTMDGGILYGGEIKGEMGSKNICGVIARFDSLGNDLWYDNIYEESCDAIFSASQLSQGGYVAAGRSFVIGSGYQGFLIKYAPETGISYPDPSTILSLEVSPNPCSSSLSVSFNLPEAGNASIRIFDLSGRLVSTVTDGEFPTGSNTVEWTVPEEIPSGCYFVQYNSDMGLCNESFMLI